MPKLHSHRLTALLLALTFLAAPAALATPDGDDPTKPLATAIAKAAPDAPNPAGLNAAVMATINEDDKLTAFDGAGGQTFGFSVSVAGDRALIGARYDNDNGSNSGSAYVFDYDGTNWSLTGKLLASDGVAGDQFGYSVSVSGDRALVGATFGNGNFGAAYVYDYDGTNWTQTAKLTASDGANSDLFGVSVSVSGDRALVGSYLDDDNGTDSGSAYVFDYDGTNWTQTAKLTASDGAATDEFGISVSLSGDRVLVGAYRDDDNGGDSGSAYVFDYDGTNWTETKLTASDGAASDRFGISVSLSGDRALVGAHQDDDNGSDSGSAYVFDYDGTNWTETKLTASDGAASDWFGYSVSVSGDRALVGAHLDDDNGGDSGSAYVFDYNGSTWTETKLIPSDGAVIDYFGWSVSISGDRALVGSYFDDDIGANSGSAYTFELPPLILPTAITVAPAASVYWPLDVATVNIDVSDMIGLFGVSADLAYPSSLVTYNDDLAAGAFLDDGTTLTFENDDNAGINSWSVTRSGASGNDGSGTVATMTFALVDNAVPGTASFSQTDIAAVDAAGNPITFDTNNGGSFEVGGVWPGDADNNCTVEAADILSIGLSFSNLGPARPGGYDLSWSAKAFSPWGGSSAAGNFADSFIDTDGDGEIDEGDVLAIGVNYNETHAETSGCDDGVPKGQRAIRWALAPAAPGTTVTLALQGDVTAALGTAFGLSVDASAYRIESIEAGGLLAGDLMELVRVNAAEGTAQAAFTRKGLGNAASGQGTLALIRLTALTGDGAEVLLSDVKLSTAQGIGPAGTGVVLDASLADGPADLPTTFALHGAYPNPFNPTTTVSFDLPESAQVRLVVIDLLGRVVQTADLGQQAAGANRQVQFSAAGLASGTYLYRLEAIGTSSMSQTGRFVLLK